jgi:hypothetical protein
MEVLWDVNGADAPFFLCGICTAARCWVKGEKKGYCEPVMCAIAVQRADITIEEKRLRTIVNDGILTFGSSETGKPMRLATDIDSRPRRCGPGN